MKVFLGAYMFVLLSLPIAMLIFIFLAYGLDKWEWKRALYPRYKEAAPLAYFVILHILFASSTALGFFGIMFAYILFIVASAIAIYFLREKIMYGVYIFPGMILFAMIVVWIVVNK